MWIAQRSSGYLLDFYRIRIRIWKFLKHSLTLAHMFLQEVHVLWLLVSIILH